MTHKPNSSSNTQSLFAVNALLPSGWEKNVRLTWNADGDLISVEKHLAQQAQEPAAVYVLPGMVNCHSHAFQRAMAGLSEIAGDGPDSFWTWRDIMYRFALQITPEQLQAIAAQLYVECLRHGYTSVCEFHYLHHDINGAPYSNRLETSQAILHAANRTGIGMTLLPVLYSHADFNGVPLRHDQRRFATSVQSILEMVADLNHARSGQVEIGAAPHSLRAASIEQIRELTTGLPQNRPIHIHIAEQSKEVDACAAAHGKRPVELLLQQIDLNHHWCLVHATHMQASEVHALAKTGAVAGICPTTEGNLGDGLFELPSYLQAGGKIAIGSDSHVSQSPIEELRWLEYGQRLRAQQRNIATHEQQRHVGDFLWQACLQGGAAASGRRVGKLEAGARADFLVLDDQHPNLQGLNTSAVLNTLVFVGNDKLVRDVFVGGKRVVTEGRHHAQESVAKSFVACMRQLRGS